MANTKPKSLGNPDQVKAQSLARRTWGRFIRHKMAVAGSLLLIFILVYVVIGSFIYSEAYANYNDPSIRLQSPSEIHIFGTDTVGRDILARTIYGGQISLLIGITSVGVSITIGTLLGMLSGFFGGWVDSIISRITEAMLTIPSLLLLLLMSKFLGNKIPNIELFGRTLSGSVVVIVLIIGVTSWMYLARIVRANVLSLKEDEYILAARAVGASNWQIIFKHLLPNTLAPIIVYATLGTANAILGEAYISFLGLGVTPPTATWGNMLNAANQYLEEAPWLWFYPGLLIVITLLGINFLGDGLRDALDPRSDKEG